MKTREPHGRSRLRKAVSDQPIFVVQEHHARRLHWDFRLEADGVLKSWAVTREPSRDTQVRRLAIETEDHPVDYASFEGEIPRGEYGAGEVTVWDHGTYTAMHPVGESLEKGVIEVFLKGSRLKGRFVLVRIRNLGGKSEWLFFKAKPKATSIRIPEVRTLKKRSSR